MAVFLINICKFNGCGITFPSLGDLIQHIEDTHIDYDPQVIEQKEQSRPACLPLSYVLRFITDAARKEGPFLGTAGAELKRKMAIKHHSYSMSSSNRSNTPTDMGSVMDEDELMVSESEDSNESWTTEEFSSEFIMRYGSRHSGPVGNSTSNEKPFACPVPGCKKRYKNVNGIKYHSKNGHKKDGKVPKGFKCHCGKSYKTAQGLKSHSLVAHNANASDAMLNVHSQLLSASPSHQQSGSLSPSSASNTSGSSSSSQHNQSQLSPNSNSISSSALNVSNNNNNNNTVGGMMPNGTIHHLQHNSQQSTTPIAGSSSLKNNFGLISIKTKAASNNNNGAGTSSAAGGLNKHNSNDRLMELDANGVKTNLPSLVNLGILTPATSPKHHQAPLTPQTPTNGHQVGNHHHNNHHTTANNHHHSQLHSQSSLNGQHFTTNNDHLLPLTPISPNMSKNVHFTNNNNNNHNNNNTTASNNNNNVAADHITTDET